MNKKRHNHKYPDFLLKNWSKDPYSKNEKRRVKYNSKRHMGNRGYYPDELEIKLSKVEGTISKIFKKIISGNYSLSKLEIIRIVIYTKIQAIRLENIVEYIDEPDLYYPGNNYFLFGVHSSNDKNEIIQLTNYFSDVFLLNNIEKMESSHILDAVSPIIWKSKNNIFCVTDNAVFKEVDLDGRFLFLLLPISPRYAIVLSKNSYFSSNENLRKNGDSRLSMSTNDKFLINNFNHEGIFHLPFTIGMPQKIPLYEIKKKDILSINSAFMKDARKLIFYDGVDEEINRRINFIDHGRKIAFKTF